MDRDDPNYDSEEEKNIVFMEQQGKIKNEVAAYKQEVRAACAGSCCSSPFQRGCVQSGRAGLLV